jgi:glycosyltransferase involved in cell wall biosynthesis
MRLLPSEARDMAQGGQVRALVLISSLATGGAERVTVSFLRRLAEQGRSALACTLTSRHDGSLARELTEACVTRWDIRARRLADPLAFVRLLMLLKRERIAVIHAHGQDACILAAAARMVSGIPLVITRHVLEEPGANWRERVRARLTLAAFRHADAAIAVSSAAADTLAGLAQMPRGSVKVIRNGIEVARFDDPDLAARRARIRASLGFRGEEFLLLVPAVLREGKGHEVLLSALPIILGQAPTLRVLFAGDGEREEALRGLARPYGDAVVFLGARDDIPELLAACDLVALPSRAEALPTVIMEAAAAGRPVVATRVGGTAELVEDGVTGLLVPPDDPAALARAVVDLWCDPAKARAFGAGAARLASRRFGLDEQVELTLAVWADVAAARRR